MGNAYIMVVLGILMAKGLGFFRDMVFAGVFGTAVVADIYFQVFGLVNLIFTGIGVALSTLIIKNVNKLEHTDNQKAYVSHFLKKSLFYLLLAVVLMAVFSPQIVKIILPELSGADFNLAIRMMYVMIPSLVFVVIAYIVSGVLQNEKVYFVTSVMSLPFNVAIILTLLVPGIPILPVSIVTTIGWLMQVLMLLPAFYKKGYSFFHAGIYNKLNQEKNFEILWIFISNMMFQLCFFTDRAFVSGNSGMAATFNYASNLFITISSIFVVAMSTVIFPAISKNYEEGNIDYVNKLLQQMITVMTAIFLPFLLVVGFFGTDVIRLVYERGSFTGESTVAVATVFLVYSLGILGYVAQELFNKVLYLAGKYRYSVIGTIVVICLNLVANILIKMFVPEVPILSSTLTATSLLITVTTSVFLCGYAVLVAVGIKKVVGTYFTRDLVRSLIKIIVSGLLASAVYLLCNTFASGITHGYISFLLPLCGCGIAYVAGLLGTGVLKEIMVMMKTKKGTN